MSTLLHLKSQQKMKELHSINIKIMLSINITSTERLKDLIFEELCIAIIIFSYFVSTLIQPNEKQYQRVVDYLRSLASFPGDIS
jgi:hypothetical protein